MKNFLILLLYIFSLSLFANEDNQIIDENLDEETLPTEFESIKLDRIKRLRSDLIRIRAEINEAKKQMTSDVDMVLRIQTEAKIKKLEEEYLKKRFNFIETITNVNLNTEESKKAKTTFTEDVKQILEPALNTFKKISEKPRQVQQYDELMEVYQQRYDSAVLAKEKLEKFEAENKDKSLKWKLKESIKETNAIVDDLKVKLDDIKFKILKIQKNEKSLVTTFSSIIFEFMKTKGKNLLLALVVFLCFFWAFKIGQSKFIDLIIVKLNKRNPNEMYHWIARPIRVVYSVLGTLVSFFMAILTLYVLNDWVLVTLILLLFTALIWSSKQYLPLFLEQSKVVLNLGSIREGERLMYNGIPWEVTSLGYYCRLVNPSLGGALLRVNTRDLLSATSRRIEKGEPWFPTDKDDWVLINGEFGKVSMQTPDQVIVESVGKERKYYNTAEFYSSGVVNLSQGFAIDFNFGVDYSHQKILFDEIIPAFQSGLKRELYNKFPEIKGKTKDFVIELATAGASSLDLRFFMECDGEIAHLKLKLERGIQAEFVRVCNEHDIIIPFNQLTVHMNNGQ